MSVELSVRPFVAPDPPPPPPPISVDEAMRRVAEATERAPIGEPLDDADVIRMRPRLGEMGIVDWLQEARPYVALALALVALLIVCRLGLQLRARYRRENVPDTSAQPMDRRSVLRKQKKAE